MPFKPNYRQQRSERNRAKEERKKEKLARRQENAEKRKSERGAPAAGDATPPTHELGEG